MHGLVAVDLSDFLSYLTTHVLGVIILSCLQSNCLDIYKYFCNNCVLDRWINLPEAFVLSQTIINFKRNLMSCDLNLYLRGSYKRIVKVPD